MRLADPLAACLAFPRHVTGTPQNRTGFQTGNTVQVAIALSRVMYDPERHHNAFRASDYQALCSVLAFALAAQVGGRILPRLRQDWELRSRAVIVASSTLQCLLTIGAAITVCE